MKFYPKRKTVRYGLLMCMLGNFVTYSYFLIRYNSFAGQPMFLSKFKVYKPPRMGQAPKPHTANDLLAVMFTTFKSNSEKESVYRTTVKNWSRMLPQIQPVLFATNLSQSLTKYAEQNGWKVVDAPRSNEYGTPYLRDMYLTVYPLFNATFYAFSNGDILYDGGLMNTLQTISQYYLASLNVTLISGQRWNYKLRGQDKDKLVELPLSSIKKFANSDMASLGGQAEDYFFVTKDFPWFKIKDVVIGRPEYDNYLVARAIELNLSVIDATKTISAVHQVDYEGVKAGHNHIDSYYNKKIIGYYNYREAYRGRIWFQTEFDSQGRLLLIHNI